MRTDDFHFDGPYRNNPKGYVTKAFRIEYTRDHWVIALQRNEEVKRMLASLPLRHREKIMAKNMILGTGPGTRWGDIKGEVASFRSNIRQQVAEYAKEAELIYNSREHQIKGV